MGDSFSSADEIKKLYGLLQDGIISQDEFDTARKRIIAGDRSGRQSEERPPRMTVQPPPVGQYEYDGPPEKSAFYQMARGFMIVALGLVALVVAGAIANAIFSSDGNDANGSSGTRQSAAPTVAMQPTQDDPGPIMTGVVVMMGVANTETPGESCYGVDDHSMLAEGESVSVTAIGGHQDNTARLSSGTVDQYGHCRMAFGIEWFDVDEYQFGFNDDLFVHCDRDDIVDIETNYTTQVRIAPNGAYCQAPS